MVISLRCAFHLQPSTNAELLYLSKALAREGSISEAPWDVNSKAVGNSWKFPSLLIFAAMGNATFHVPETLVGC